MEKNLIASVFVMVSILSSSVGYAQPLVDRLTKFADDFAKGYTAPLVDAFGAALNSGWYNTANVDDGISLEVGIRVLFMPIPDDGKTFQIASPYDGVVQTVPTAFGPKDEVVISRTNISPPTLPVDPDKYPKGYNIGFAPLMVPHISAGNIFGTRVMLRYFPKTNMNLFGFDIGKFELFGVGAQHSISRYIPLIPLDISGLAAFQRLTIGGFNAKSFTFGAQASKSFVLLTVYGGLAYETSSMNFSYVASFTDPLNPTGAKIQKAVVFDADGKNNVRVTAGVRLSLAVVKLNVDYSLAAQPVLTLGIGFGI